MFALRLQEKGRIQHGKDPSPGSNVLAPGSSVVWKETHPEYIGFNLDRVELLQPDEYGIEITHPRRPSIAVTGVSALGHQLG